MYLKFQVDFGTECSVQCLLQSLWSKDTAISAYICFASRSLTHLLCASLRLQKYFQVTENKGEIKKMEF